MITEIHSASEWEEFTLAHQDQLIIVLFSAKWCKPCKIIAPHFAQRASESSSTDRRFVKIDLDEADSQLWEWAMVEQVPTFRFWRNGETVVEFSDSKPDVFDSYYLQSFS